MLTTSSIAQDKSAREAASARMERLKKDMEDRNQERLKKCLDKLEAANSKKNSDPNGYIEALVQTAYAYRSTHENQKADDCFNNAFEFFRKLNVGAAKTIRVSTMMRYASNYEDYARFKQVFDALEEVAEKNSSVDISNLDSDLSDAIDTWCRRRRYDRDNAGADKSDDRGKSLWKKVIECRTAVRGPNDKSLMGPLSRYASTCEASGDIAEAEQYMLRVKDLQQGDVTSNAIAELNIAHFYLRHNMFEKFQAAWQKADKLMQGHISQPVARSFVYLIEQCRKSGRTSDAEAIINTLLAEGGDAVIEALDPIIEDLVDLYIRSGHTAKAQALIEKRVKASANATEDFTHNDWRLKLSDTYLSTGRAAESNKIFKEVLASRALQGVSNDAILVQRAALLRRLGMVKEAQSISVAPVRSTGPIKLRFGLFAAQEIRFGHNTMINSYDSSNSKDRVPYARLDPEHGDAGVCCMGTIRCEGNFMMSGTVYGKTVPPMRQMPPQMVHAGHGASYAPLPPDLKPAPPALKPPHTSASDLSQRTGNRSSLKPGDFVVSQLNSSMIPSEKGRFRFFLVDEGASGPYICDVRSFGINNNVPADLQIWYEGTKKIKVDGLTALVYAPNATVEIPFNGRFSGAIVANRIVGQGNNQYSLDKRLLDQEFK